MVTVPKGIDFASLLYLNYEPPCRNSDSCRNWICDNFIEGVFVNINAIANPNYKLG